MFLAAQRELLQHQADPFYSWSSCRRGVSSLPAFLEYVTPITRLDYATDATHPSQGTKSYSVVGDRGTVRSQTGSRAPDTHPSFSLILVLLWFLIAWHCRKMTVFISNAR